MSRSLCTSVLERVTAGGRMSAAEGLRIYQEADLEELTACARELRNRFADPHQATYLVDRNVNYTNVCVTDCKFCEFYRPPGHHQAYVLPWEVLEAKLEELVAVGGTRVLLQGGHHPELPLTWYEDLLRKICSRFPSLQIDAFSPPEIEHIARLEGLEAEVVLERLGSAGLRGVPGGGAEILEDEIRQRVSPKKTRTRAWLEIMGAAHRLKLYTSASQVFGFGEEPRHRIAALEALRARQDRSLDAYGFGFLAFIAWPLQYRSRYGAVFGGLKGLKLGGSAEEYLRHTAFCRVFLDNIPHLQASWPTMGLETARQALQCGCDDMGGTMMEENVVSQAGSMHCSVSEAAMRAAILQAGFRPVKRDSWYRPLTVAANASSE